MADLRYAVVVDDPTRHLVDIELEFAPRAATTDLTLPAWCPGSYLIRDYARFVRDLRAVDQDGAPVSARKVDKATWRLDTAGARAVTVRYALYAHDLTVRTNHVDATHAFLHGPATFVYPITHRDAAAQVAVRAPPRWVATCALAWADGAGPPADGLVLAAASVDELLDSPLHLADPAHVRAYPVAARVPTRLVVWGERVPGGAFGEPRLAEDLAAIVDDHAARMGEVPFAHYTYVLLLAHDGYGGLEHRASSVNMFHPHFGTTRKAYEGLLELLSHEVFHAWNGKRLAPPALSGAIDLGREAYTRALWVMEGVTSHYDRFALRTAGRITARSFLDKVLDDWARLQATPGRARHSLEDASFDAWIKLYKPDESNLNSTVSYYLKGGLVALALDLEIRRRTEGARSLDDVVRALWRRYGARGEPHPEELQPVFEEATGLALGDAFAAQVRGTADPPLPAELRHVGLELRASAEPGGDGAGAAWLGATLTGPRVTGVFDGGPAQAAGLSPGDELAALDRFRATTEAEVRALVAPRRPGEVVVVHAFRRHRLVELEVALAAAPPTRYEVAGLADAGPAAARYQAWLGEAHPGGQVLATITTGGRWV